MNEEHKIINLKDKDQENVAEYFHTMEKENYKLSRFIMENLEKNTSIGIRDDVLKYISENAAGFGEDQSYLFNIACFVNNLKVTAEHLAWVNDFFTNNEKNHLSIDDFSIVFIEAVERDIPLPKIKSLFLSEDNEIVIYEKVVDYDPDNQEEPEEQPTIPIKEDEKRIVVEQKQEEEPGYADVFGSLISVLSIKNDASDAIHTANDNFNKIVAKFQLATSEFAAYSAEIIHEMETDKKEIERLTALMGIQQKLMNSQQNKINELRNEIVKLNFKIQNAEKTEMRREAINQKISELQNLTLNKHQESSEGYYLND